MYEVIYKALRPGTPQDGLFGTPYGLYTGSGAFESELGVQPPVGFWDPLGFTKTDDAASFRRRRYVELKHGRVAMFAPRRMAFPSCFLRILKGSQG